MPAADRGRSALPEDTEGASGQGDTWARGGNKRARGHEDSRAGKMPSPRGDTVRAGGHEDMRTRGPEEARTRGYLGAPGVSRPNRQPITRSRTPFAPGRDQRPRWSVFGMGSGTPSRCETKPDPMPAPSGTVSPTWIHGRPGTVSPTSIPGRLGRAVRPGRASVQAVHNFPEEGLSAPPPKAVMGYL